MSSATRRGGFLPAPDPTLTDPCDRCGGAEGQHLICGCQHCGTCAGFVAPVPTCPRCGERFADSRRLAAHRAERPNACRRAERYGRQPATAGAR